MTDDIRWLMCTPRTQIPGTASVVRACADCAVEVWVSREMHREVDAGRMCPLCPPCMTIRIEARPDARAEVHPAQTDNLAKLGLLGYADQVVTAWNHNRRGRDE